MKQYIFMIAEGTTFAPWDISTDEAIETENCQLLGKAQGKNQREAKQNLLEGNSWIVEHGFSPDEIFGYELARKATRTRAILKALTYRSITTLITFGIAWLVCGKLDIAVKIGMIDVVAKLIVYYAHERFWEKKE